MKTLTKKHALIITKLIQQSDLIINTFGPRTALNYDAGDFFVMLTPAKLVVKWHKLRADTFLTIHFDTKKIEEAIPPCTYNDDYLQFETYGNNEVPDSYSINVNTVLEINTNSNLLDVESSLFSLNVLGHNIDKTAEELLETVNSIGSIKTTKPAMVHIKTSIIEEHEFESLVVLLKDIFMDKLDITE